MDRPGPSQGRLLYRPVRRGATVGEDPPAPHDVLVEDLLPGPGRAVLFSHWTGTWRFDPWTVNEAVMTDSAQGGGTLVPADRAAAERTATSMGHPLPDEATLLRLMDEGASRMYARDDRVKPIPWED